MSQATIGALRVVLGLDSAEFTEGLTAARRHLRDVGASLQSIGAGMMNIGAGLSAAVTAPLIGLGALAVTEAGEMRAAVAQVEAALASMGNAGGRSLEQLTAQADRLAATSLFEDDQILQKVTANLLTFGNVSGAAFDRAQQAALDLSTRLGQDLQSSAIMVGKALNDPVAGLAALRRVGIQLTEQQQAQVKSMVAVGDVAGAQAIILGELERQFGGAAQAARDNAPPMERMRLALAGLAGEIGEVLLPVVDRLAAWFERLTARFETLSPSMRHTVVVFGAVAAAVGPVMIALGALVSSAGALVAAFGGGGVLAGLVPLLGPIGIAAAAVAAAFVLFGDDVVPALRAFCVAVWEALGPTLQPLFEAVNGLLSGLGEVFASLMGEGTGEIVVALGAFGTLIGRVFASAIEIITGAVNVVTNVLRALGALLRGDFSAMWGFLGQAVLAAVGGIGRAFQSLFPEVVNWVRQTYEGVRSWLVDRFNALVRQIGERVAAVGDFFRNLYIAVVGNSWIPDMVVAIADWMGPRLQAAMVDPAQQATATTNDAFSGMANDVSSTLDGLFRSISSKDWRGALGGVLDLLSGSGGSIGKFAGIGKSILSSLPGFANGGSFKVGGSGGIDSQLVAFRATPSERVSITKDGQGMAGGVNVTVTPSPYFDVQVQQIAGPVAAQAGVQAFAGARQAVPADMARRDAYRRG